MGDHAGLTVLVGPIADRCPCRTQPAHNRPPLDHPGHQQADGHRHGRGQEVERAEEEPERQPPERAAERRGDRRADARGDDCADQRGEVRIAASKNWVSKSPRYDLTIETDGVQGVVWSEVQPSAGRTRRTVCALIIGETLAVEGLDAGWNA